MSIFVRFRSIAFFEDIELRNLAFVAFHVYNLIESCALSFALYYYMNKRRVYYLLCALLLGSLLSALLEFLNWKFCFSSDKETTVSTFPNTKCRASIRRNFNKWLTSQIRTMHKSVAMNDADEMMITNNNNTNMTMTMTTGTLSQQERERFLLQVQA